MKITAACTWGDGPDIVLSTTTEDNQISESFDLTVKEALDLIHQLSMAVTQVLELEQVAKDHDDQMEKADREFMERL